MKEFYASCARLLNDGADVVLSTIISLSGSAPRTAGTKMLIKKDGTFVGTIGGGLLEAQVLEFAREVFSTGRSVIKEFDLTGADTDSMDMICGGRMKVYIEFLSARTRENIDIYGAIKKLIHSRHKALLATRLPAGDDGGQPLKCLFTPDGGQIGCAMPPGRREKLLEKAGRTRYPVQVQLDGEPFLVEPVSSLSTVFLFGAGHVSQQVAMLTAMVGFHTVVLDDREQFANRRRFPRADEIIVLDGFADFLRHLPVSDDSYLVIVTRGHQYDMTVLEQAMRTSARYIGMIGSRRKIDAIYRTLREKGVTNQQLARVHSPIGIAINAETPEEIAVSIVAQLIKVRGESVHV